MQAFLSRQYRPIFTLLFLVAIALAFYVGTLQGQKGSGGGVTLACSDTVLSALSIPAASPEAKKGLSVPLDDLKASAIDSNRGVFIGSKNGTKYYTPDCPAAKRIKPENIVWFQTAEDASLQGYSPAAC